MGKNTATSQKERNHLSVIKDALKSRLPARNEGAHMNTFVAATWSAS